MYRLFLTAARSVNRCHVDFLHGHHGVERALRFIASGDKRFYERARRNLPRYAPTVLAPSAVALLAAVSV
jgi:hypothetical protein